MGLCLSKFPGGGVGGSAVLHHAPSPNQYTHATSVMLPVLPLATTSSPPHVIKNKNLVAPQPTVSSPHGAEDARLQQGGSTRSLNATRAAESGRSSRKLLGTGKADEEAVPIGHMKRSYSLVVHNSDERLPSGSNTHAFAAAASAAAPVATESSAATPPPPSQDTSTQETSSASTNVKRHMSLRPARQHCGSERNESGQLQYASPPRRLKKPVAVSLEILLRDERARLGFFTYLQNTALQEKLREVEHKHADAEASLMKRRMSKMTSSRSTFNYREDCVLFWLEMSDLLKIPSGGSFHLGLMQDLFDVYIVKGALRQLPMVSAAEREPLAQFLQDKNSERALLALKTLLLDVLEVVTTQFDEFVRCEGKLGYAHVTKSASMRNVLTRLAKVSVGNTGGRRVHVNEIVNTPALSRIFREFLQERNSVETLLFIVDALAFEDLVNSFAHEPDVRGGGGGGDSVAATPTAATAPAAPDGSHHDYYLRQAQKIFTKYIRYGSKAEICLSGAIKEKILREIIEYPIGADVFSDAVLMCSAELVHSHLDAFYGTSAYLAYKAARSNAGQAPRKVNGGGGGGAILKRKSLGGGSQASGSMRRLGGGSGATGGIVDGGTADTDAGADISTATANGPLLRLGEILDGSGASYWRAFLKEQGLEHTLLFYKEVCEFQRLPHSQRQYIQSKARKLFDKFVRRGGKLELELPDDVRRDILWKLAAPTEYTFADAQRFVLQDWECTHLKRFQHHRLHTEMLAALHKLPHFGLASSGGGSGGGSETRIGNMHGSGMSGSTSSVSGFTTTSSNASSSEYVDVGKITLREFLDVDVLRRRFRLFLEKEQCVNELFFYCEVQGFQQFPTSDYLARQAKKLCARFCDPASREFVALPPALRAELHASLSHPSPAMFNRAQDEVLAFFTTTLFPKFQQSELYRTLRITHAELRLERLAAHSGGDRDRSDSSIQVRGGTRDSVLVGGVPRPSTSPTRTRGSIAAAGSAGTELREDQVTVKLILEHQETRALFLFFSEEIFCTESIYFWVDCNEFKDIPHKSYLKLRAQKIYRKYIAGHAKLQVNIESAIIKDIVAHLDDPSRTLFVPAQASITKMLERDTLPKFRRSKHFQPCLQLLRQDVKTSSMT